MTFYVLFSKIAMCVWTLPLFSYPSHFTFLSCHVFSHQAVLDSSGTCVEHQLQLSHFLLSLHRSYFLLIVFAPLPNFAQTTSFFVYSFTMVSPQDNKTTNMSCESSSSFVDSAVRRHRANRLQRRLVVSHDATLYTYSTPLTPMRPRRAFPFGAVTEDACFSFSLDGGSNNTMLNDDLLSILDQALAIATDSEDIFFLDKPTPPTSDASSSSFSSEKETEMNDERADQ